jgi:effector-binding domain-containing protein
MTRQPQIQARAAQPYVGIPATVTMQTIGTAVDGGFPELFGWLASQGIEPGGAPFIRYLVIDMDGDLQIELGVPVSAPANGSGRIRPGVLPAGSYAVLRHTGPYDGLVAANGALQQWAAEHGVRFDTSDTPQGSAWGGRVESYLTDPSQAPDPATWQTDVAYLTS